MKEKLHPESIVVVTSQNGALLREYSIQVQPVDLLVSHTAHELLLVVQRIICLLVIHPDTSTAGCLNI